MSIIMKYAIVAFITITMCTLYYFVVMKPVKKLKQRFQKIKKDVNINANMYMTDINAYEARNNELLNSLEKLISETDPFFKELISEMQLTRNHLMARIRKARCSRQYADLQRQFVEINSILGKYHIPIHDEYGRLIEISQRVNILVDKCRECCQESIDDALDRKHGNNSDKSYIMEYDYNMLSDKKIIYYNKI